MDFKIGKTEVFGVDFAIKASGNPMRTEFNRDDVDEKDLKRAKLLGGCKGGEGHDCFLKGCVVEFDVTAPLYWWKQAQRYHWFDYVSSQSTMHCLLKFDVTKQCVKETNPEILKIVSRLKDEYNAIPETDIALRGAKWRELVASLPCGFCLGATMVTNYQELKTMYRQRKMHKLIEWHEFCAWCETLPHFLELTGLDKTPEEAK
jgi:hypothetical protein